MSTGTRSLTAALVGCGLLLVAGCDAAQPDRLLAPEPGIAAPAAPTRAIGYSVPLIDGSAVGAREIKTVMGRHTGGAMLVVDPDATTIQNWFTFDAKRTRGDAATGTFQFVADYKGIAVVITGAIVCYTVEGNRARVGGIVTASSFAEIPIGTAQTWSLTDNDTSLLNLGDSGSTFLGGDGSYAMAYCTAGLPYPERPFVAGGVVINR